VRRNTGQIIHRPQHKQHVRINVIVNQRKSADSPLDMEVNVYSEEGWKERMSGVEESSIYASSPLTMDQPT
jgi:hypothetical protein